MGKKEANNEPASGEATPKPKKGKFGFIILTVFTAILSAVFFPTALVLAVGMLPTLGANIGARGGVRAKTLTVGAMNLAGCVPFLLDLWSSDSSIPHAISLIRSPRTIVVIWSAASIGYLINWAMAGIVNTIMVQRANMQLKDLKKQQLQLVERWGPEVKRDMPVDADGFPLEVKPAGTR